MSVNKDADIGSLQFQNGKCFFGMPRLDNLKTLVG